MTCRVDGCEATAGARRLCARHYQQDWHRRNPGRGKVYTARWRARKKRAAENT